MQKQNQPEPGATKLRIARQSKKIKQVTMAKILRRARSSYNSLEKRGVRTMRLATIIGRVLDIPAKDIIEPKENRVD